MTSAGAIASWEPPAPARPQRGAIQSTAVINPSAMLRSRAGAPPDPPDNFIELADAKFRNDPTIRKEAY